MKTGLSVIFYLINIEKEDKHIFHLNNRLFLNKKKNYLQQPSKGHNHFSSVFVSSVGKAGVQANICT